MFLFSDSKGLAAKEKKRREPNPHTEPTGFPEVFDLLLQFLHLFLLALVLLTL